MFKNLLSRLFADDTDPSPLSGSDADVAVAALLVRLARADDRYSAAEKQDIDKVLMSRKNLDPETAAEHRAAAEMIEAEAPDTVRFTRLIKDRIPLEDRIGVVGAMWQVAYSDGARSAEEDAVIRLTAKLLGVTDRESAVARQDVLEARSAG